MSETFKFSIDLLIRIDKIIYFQDPEWIGMNNKKHLHYYLCLLMTQLSK
jgi:hypothetical protein